jgi:hypothetical protein
MHTRVRSSAISRFTGVVIAAWLIGIGPAWSGDGGDDLGIQAVLDKVCTDAGMPLTSCPEVPTITQAILEMSGLANAAPDFVRGPQGPIVANLFGPHCFVSSSVGLPVCSQSNAISAVNPPAASPVDVSDLPNLTPLAFTTGKGQAVPVPLGTKGADSFFYAVATGPNGEPNAVTAIFDYPALTSSSFQTGQVVAKVSLPLQVLNNDGSERLICGAAGCPASLATLQISACSSGLGCVNGFAANVSGDFSSPGTIVTKSADSLGIQAPVSFGSSPNSSRSHLILKVQIPLLITAATDPAYFGVPVGVLLVNQLSGLPTAFTSDVVPPTKIGVTPQAAPACPNGGSCPPPTTTYPFCASFAGNGGGSLNSAVATFLSIGTDATTYVSSPVPAALVGSPLKCPF